jgi:uncharacterized membrane protein YeaQ/YmgE (transglycosylase-associated protein family)
MGSERRRSRQRMQHQGRLIHAGAVAARHPDLQSACRNWPILIENSRRKKTMFHLIWYILVGLIAGVIAKSVMHVHMTIFWTIILGIIGSIVGGAVTHLFSRPTNERFHPAGIIFSTLGAILILFICYKLKIHFPRIG